MGKLTGKVTVEKPPVTINDVAKIIFRMAKSGFEKKGICKYLQINEDSIDVIDAYEIAYEEGQHEFQKLQYKKNKE